jgi:predicted enzyme related to lactoylglutathione lyase
MIVGTHALLYAEQPELARAFLRDVLELPNVDAHGGWLIFALPPAELGVHPAAGDTAPNGRHELYLMCDDIEATVAELTGKGVQFTGPVEDQGWGLLATFILPGAGEVGLYQARHATAFDLPK